MPSTYTGAPATVQRDAVRFLARDTGPTTFVLTDAEVDFLIGSEANSYMAAAAACDAIVDRAFTSKSIGELSLSTSKDSYEALAKRLRLRGSSHQIFSVGGISKSDKLVYESDTDRISLFRIGQHDNNNG